MKVTHVTEEMVVATTQALLKTVPEYERKLSALPPLVEQWVTVLETEFRGWRYRADLGCMCKSV